MTTARHGVEPADIAPFAARHIGPNGTEIQQMLGELGYESLDAFIDAVVPEQIRYRGTLDVGAARTEHEVLADFRALAAKNQVFRSFIGMGYSGTLTPPVIQRNVVENPSWYTAYTPYQAEIANASLLDEGTAAAEAMSMSYGARGKAGKETFFVSELCHPQTIDVVRTRAAARGFAVVVGDHATYDFGDHTFGALLQYPATDGAVLDYRTFCEQAHAADALVTVATDLLALALLAPPAEWGADVAVGNSQRFGVPIGYGGPHAAFFATRDEFKRQLPGRIIGVSRDADGKPALRMALQTREQHIRREKATSNVCTAQVLLAVVASMYAVYHGPVGIRRIAERVKRLATTLGAGLEAQGHRIAHDVFFDTVRVELAGTTAADVMRRALERRINLRQLGPTTICVALDEATRDADLDDLFAVFGGKPTDARAAGERADARFDERFARTSPYLTHPNFSRFHSETEMLRYMHRLQERDLSLTHSMIPLGSCTMKLNATAEMMPITWPEFNSLHPFVPVEQAAGYQEMFRYLEHALAEVTGFAAVSLQPNAGSAGEYAGLLAIRGYHESRGDTHRNVCLIPQSAHGTNPASAVMAGMKVVVTKTDESGNIDVADLKARAEEHAADLSCLMVTYPSTHGVFEESIREVCEIVHANGGLVYMDGANMNAMVGVARPGDIGADVCHLNLHKTFCIPHGGGGPGMGPIGVVERLKPFLPGHAVVQVPGHEGHGAVSAAPWGSASILPISTIYIQMMGGAGLALATKIAILNANYVAHRLEEHYPVLYRGKSGLCAHECIIDPRALKATSGVEVEDIAKRLMDYGFHAPTVSFPVAGTLMIEPTESEAKEELDRFCEAMISIREEIRQVEIGVLDRADNPLKHAPHPMDRVIATEWTHGYTREQAAFPAPYVRLRKFWPSVARVESAYGDRNLVCSCLPTDAYADVATSTR